MNSYDFGEVNEIKVDFSKIQLPEESSLDFSWRQQEKIEIIHFLLTKEKRILQIYGSEQIQMDTIVKAVKYTAERDMSNFSHGSIRVDLEGYTSI